MKACSEKWGSFKRISHSQVSVHRHQLFNSEIVTRIRSNKASGIEGGARKSGLATHRHSQEAEVGVETGQWRERCRGGKAGSRGKGSSVDRR